MNISLSEVEKAVWGKIFGNPEQQIDSLLIDSRSAFFSDKTLFFALEGSRHNGHNFIGELMKKGVQNFVVREIPQIENCEKFNFIVVENTLKALQNMAFYFRLNFRNRVVGITGSNGKTVVKEWLFQLLHDENPIVRSPKSYNSQVGVPLSLALLDNNSVEAFIEAGISLPGEMEILEKMIRPEIGIFTCIGNAHQENFQDLKSKIKEKFILFKNSESIIYCRDYDELDNILNEEKQFSNKKLFSWSEKKEADLTVEKIEKTNHGSQISVCFKSNKIIIFIPFQDKASVENAMTCLAYIILTRDIKTFNFDKFSELSHIEMRLEIKKGTNNCTIINDSYNSDITSLGIALDLLANQNQHSKKTLIISDILQSGFSSDELYSQISEIIKKYNIHRLIGIGKSICKQQEIFQFISENTFFESTQMFLNSSNTDDFRNEAILLKGSRQFAFESISEFLQEKKHRTVLEINFAALVHNLNYYRSLLSEKTKIMVMVKAFSYGSGTYEIANLLQHQRIDYLGVAYVDEGISLRKSGISVPIMVMNPEIDNFSNMIDFNLEPEVYSFRILRIFTEAARKRGASDYPIHIKIDTGMRRLGFLVSEIEELISVLKKNPYIRVKSVFSHLAATDENFHDDFTNEQISTFKNISLKISEKLNYPIIRHILNSSGIERFSDSAFEMVRLGIGLYGFSPANQDKLMNVSTMKTKISQIKKIKTGETVGYSRKGKAESNIVIAVVPVGYADGLSRALSNGKGKMQVNGKFASIIGNVCMDMCMLNITGIEAEEGDEVIIFGENFTAADFAKQLNTIPYEIITGISERVKRIYFH
jgi:alanine racemase